MLNIFHINHIGELDSIAKELLNLVSPYRKFAFFGEMGVGKTTFIKALTSELGAQDIVSSPTFSIVNEYVTKDQEKIYHFDFYRIKDESEAYDIGYEEYFSTSAYCFIEWSEKIPNLIDDTMVKILMSFNDEKRVIQVNI
mgnify:FL=1